MPIRFQVRHLGEGRFPRQPCFQQVKHVGAALASVERGEAVTITYRGKPAARLVAADEGKVAQGAATMPAFGMWRDRQDLTDVAAHVRELRGGCALAG